MKTKWDTLLIWVIGGFLAIFIGYALCSILLLSAKYDNLLPFTGTVLDRIIIVIAVIALIALFCMAWKWDKQGLFPRNDPEEEEQRCREWDMIYYSRKGTIQGRREEQVARINRNLNYLLVFNGIILVVLGTCWNFLQTVFQNNPSYLFAIILAPVIAILIYDFWYSDEIRVLENLFPDPSARLWLRVSRGSRASPLFTAAIVVFFILAVCSVVCSVFIPVNTSLGFLFPSLFPATVCIVCILARVK